MASAHRRVAHILRSSLRHGALLNLECPVPLLVHPRQLTPSYTLTEYRILWRFIERREMGKSELDEAGNVSDGTNQHRNPKIEDRSAHRDKVRSADPEKWGTHMYINWLASLAPLLAMRQ